MSATPFRAQRGKEPNPDSLRSIRAGAVWTGLPLRERHLLQWLLVGDIVSAELASLLVYQQLRTAQRRLRRLASLGLVHGFWSAGAHRPRGRYGYVLTRASRSDIERLQWPEGRPDRPPDMPGSAPIHQLATLDLLAAFLRHADPLLDEGLVAWVPERVCGQLFGGFLRPDALAVIRVRDHAIALFVERDLGTERGDDLGEKIRRYRSVFARAPGLTVNVGFIVESARRARTVREQADRQRGRTTGLTVVSAIDEQLRRDPLGAPWTDGTATWSIRQLPPVSGSFSEPILIPGCLADGDVLAAFDDRVAAMLPALQPYLRV
jgi:Replication-relaxation